MKSLKHGFVSLFSLFVGLTGAATGCRGADSKASADDASPVLISPADPASVQKGLDAAVRAGRGELVIPPGVYRIPPASTGSGPEAWHLVVDHAKNLKIKATGAILIFTSRSQASMNFTHCENVTFEGATLIREMPVFSQGRIEAISPDGKAVTVRIAKGYPTDIDNQTFFPNVWMHVFDPARKWKTCVRAGAPPVMEKLEPDLFRIHTESAKDVGVPVNPGDLVAWRGMVFSDVRIFECSNMKMIGVTVKNGAGFCFHEMGGDGGNYYEKCRVTYGPRPPGATEDPLFAANADGFHSHDARKGPTLSDCLFEGLDDDAIAIHGTYAMALEVNGIKVIGLRTANARNKLICQVGDTLRFYDTNIVLAGEARVTGVKSLPDYKPTFEPGANYAVFRSKTRIGYVELTLDREVPAQPSWLIADEDQNAAGYVIRDCAIRDIYGARGILAKGSNGLIEGCAIERTSRAGIEFNTETGLWSESDYAHDVVVRNNVIRAASSNRVVGLLRHPGALTILAFRATNNPYADVGNYIPNPGGHRNITIENNRFEDNDGVNVVVCSAQGVTIRNNQFVNPMTHPDEYGRDKGVDPRALIWINESSKVDLSGNIVTNPGAYLAKLVEATASGSGTGFNTGVRFAAHGSN